jgi:hypothetical protein
MSQNLINSSLTTLSDTEYADLARHGKVDFRLFCEKYDLPFHFPDVEVHNPEMSLKQSSLFYKALNLFNEANRKRVYVVNGKPVIFAYSFGGLDMEYQAYDAKELLHEYLQLQEKQVELKNNEARWIAVSAIVALLVGSILLHGWMWPVVLVCVFFGVIIWRFKKKLKINNEQSAKLKFEKKVALLREGLLELRRTVPNVPGES